MQACLGSHTTNKTSSHDTWTLHTCFPPQNGPLNYATCHPNTEVPKVATFNNQQESTHLQGNLLGFCPAFLLRPSVPGSCSRAAHLDSVVVPRLPLHYTIDPGYFAPGGCPFLVPLQRYTALWDFQPAKNDHSFGTRWPTTNGTWPNATIRKFMALPMITLEAEFDLDGNEVRFWKASTALDVWNLKFFESWKQIK